MKETNVHLGAESGVSNSESIPNITAIGYQAQITDDGTFKTGSGSIQTGESVVIGSNSKVTHPLSVAIGHEAQSLHQESTPGGGHRCGTAVGWQASSCGHGCSAFGAGADATGNRAIAIGRQSKTKGTHSIAMGYRARAPADHTLALGAHAEATASGAVAIGEDAVNDQPNSVVIALDGNPALQLEKDGTLRVAGDVIANGEIKRRKNKTEKLWSKARGLAHSVFDAFSRRLKRFNSNED